MAFSFWRLTSNKMTLLTQPNYIQPMLIVVAIMMVCFYESCVRALRADFRSHNNALFDGAFDSNASPVFLFHFWFQASSMLIAVLRDSALWAFVVKIKRNLSAWFPFPLTVTAFSESIFTFLAGVAVSERLCSIFVKFLKRFCGFTTGTLTQYNSSGHECSPNRAFVLTPTRHLICA